MPSLLEPLVQVKYGVVEDDEPLQRLLQLQPSSIQLQPFQEADNAEEAASPPFQKNDVVAVQLPLQNGEENNEGLPSQLQNDVVAVLLPLQNGVVAVPLLLQNGVVVVLLPLQNDENCDEDLLLRLNCDHGPFCFDLLISR